MINKTLHKVFLICAKYSSYLYAIIQIIGLIGCSLGKEFTFLQPIGGCSILTLVILFLISIVFNFCATHRVPLYYISSVYLIHVLDSAFNFGDLGILRTYFINAGIFTLVYILVWYKTRSIPKIDNITYFCKCK